MSWFRRSRPPAPHHDEPEEALQVGGDRIVFWKATSESIYGPVWIADANDPDVRLEEPTELVTWEGGRRTLRGPRSVLIHRPALCPPRLRGRE